MTEAKDEAQLIKTASEDNEPFEPDDYLECLLQNIRDEIEMNGLESNEFVTNADNQNAKSVSDVTTQPIGSTEFKIEVASACLESGLPYQEFARIYNLNADELNAWAIEFLGTGLN